MKIAIRKTLIIIVCLVAVACLIEALQLLSKARNVKSASMCLSHLRVLDSLKAEWALENSKQSNSTPDWNDLRPYFPKEWSNQIPVCPDGGVYIIRRVSELPKCSIGGSMHSLQ